MAGVNLTYNDDNTTKDATTSGFSGSNVVKAQTMDEVFFNDSGVSIPPGDWVEMVQGFGAPGPGRRIRSTASADSAATVGVAMETIDDGTWGTVRRSGIINGLPVSAGGDGVTVKVAGSVAGPVAVTTTAVAGECATAVATDINVIGILLIGIGVIVMDVRCL